MGKIHEQKTHQNIYRERRGRERHLNKLKRGSSSLIILEMQIKCKMVQLHTEAVYLRKRYVHLLFQQAIDF